ncbi:hypothetical protein B0T18DRAFT_70508 [Schizothecium vesticola]|uniref:Uncharacterized protein n=1 Tax=Schizothecium vesticola TaxID=314040 RepID=A0AA40KA37_9PEZI|nr:hypothetical protein B0T18DRAFT_70508 [Schizothecium vesticola]
MTAIPTPIQRNKNCTAKKTRPTGSQQEKDSGYKTRYNNNDAVKTQEEQERRKKSSLDAITAGRPATRQFPKP